MIKKTIVLLIALLILQTLIFAKKISYSINLNSGFFRFSGKDSYSQIGIILSPVLASNFYSHPGRKSGFSYETSLQGQKVTRKKIIYGLELSYQSFQSKTDVSAISPSIFSSSVYMADGSSTLTTRFIGINPFGGYRLINKKKDNS